MFYPEENADVTIRLFDVQGKLVAQKMVSLMAQVPTEQTLDLHDNLLKPGVYFVKISMPSGFASFKVVKL